MFSIVLCKEHKKPSGGVYQLRYKNAYLCKMEEWAFASCAVNAFINVRADNDLWSKKLVDELCEWLKKNHGIGGWSPQEVYFCITAHQVTYLTNLVKHPRVKKIDVFTNKAHGGARMHLYRLSVQNDFPGRKQTQS